MSGGATLTRPNAPVVALAVPKLLALSPAAKIGPLTGALPVLQMPLGLASAFGRSATWIAVPVLYDEAWVSPPALVWMPTATCELSITTGEPLLPPVVST